MRAGKDGIGIDPDELEMIASRLAKKNLIDSPDKIHIVSEKFDEVLVDLIDPTTRQSNKNIRKSAQFTRNILFNQQNSEKLSMSTRKEM